MKEILIMRHAKSDWSDGAQSDFDRGLNARGQKAAPRMGQYLKDNEIVPDIIISSPAKRAITTAKLLAKTIAYNDKIMTDDNLYYGFTQHYFLILQKLDNSIMRPMLVGHNPIVENLVQILADNPDFREHLATATIVRLQANIDEWANLRPESCKVLSVQKPKEL